MKQKLTEGQRIVASVKDAIDFAAGIENGTRLTTVPVHEVDARKIRRKLKLSQSEFAARFGLPAATIQNWEQGRTKPDAPARILLAVIDRHPEAVEDALRHTS
ncbi:MAG: type II toxin-antitoxin system MqsA family antitoxin [Bryobacteraceae bacterium]|nr:type II toxin-antitoxin system MqsA family antitoxin [Bryobacteraceae bacterium]